MNLRTTRKIFRQSPRTHRPVLRWTWNALPDPDRAVEQAEGILENGFGGLWIEAGLALPEDLYLGEEWHRALNAVARRVRKRRDSIWLHEPLEAARMPEFRDRLKATPSLCLHWLRPRIEPIHGIDFSSCAAVFRLAAHPYTPETPPSLDALRRCDILERISDAVEQAEGWALVFTPERDPDRPSPLRADTATALLQSTLLRTQAATKRYFGNTIGLALLGPVDLAVPPGALPWDPDIVAVYEEAFDEDLRALLPDLFFDSPASARIRHDFRALIAGMAREGLGLTFERIFGAARMHWAFWVAHRGGSAEFVRPLQSMSLMAFQNFPVAAVTPDARDTSNAIRIKEASSLNHQLRKNGVLCLTESGNDAPWNPTGTRRHLNTCLALGGTYVALGNALLSFSENADDGPSAMDFRQPYFPLLKPILDAASRASWILSQGHHECEVLLLRPNVPAPHAVPVPWTTQGDPETLFYRHYEGIAETLLAHQIDFDVADERLLGELGRATRRRLAVGEHLYSIVIVPPCDSLRASTYRLLQDFATGGGHALFVGNAPRKLDGRDAREWSTFLERYATRVCDGPGLGDYAAIIPPLLDWEARKCAFAAAAPQHCIEDLRVQYRRWEDSDVVFVANAGDRPIEATMTFTPACTGTVERWDIDSGAESVVGRCEAGTALELPINVSPGAAALWLTLPVENEPTPGDRSLKLTREVPTEWWGRRHALNSVRLSVLHGKTPGTLTAEYEWQGPPPESPLLLVTHCPGNAAVSHNGTRTEPADAPGPFAREFTAHRLGLPAAGTNRIAIQSDTHTEPLVCLFGDLQPIPDAQRVRVAASSNRVGFGAWRPLGLAQYTGSVVYATEVQGYDVYDGDRVVLEAPGLRGAARLRVNGQFAGHLLYPPYTCDITAFWRPARLTLELEVPGDLRSLVLPGFESNTALLDPPRIRIWSAERP